MIHEAIHTLIKSSQYECFPGNVPQQAKFPFVNHFQVSANQGPSKDGNQIKDIRYQISVFAKMKADALTISESIISILDEFSGHVAGHKIDLIRLDDENDQYEDGAEVYHRILDFRIRYK